MKRLTTPRPIEYALLAVLGMAMLIFLIDLAVTTDAERIDRATVFAAGVVAHVPADHNYCGKPICPRDNSFFGTRATYQTLEPSVEKTPGGHRVWFRDPRSCAPGGPRAACNHVRVLFRDEQPHSIAYFPKIQ